MHRIGIVGAGFGGISAARSLCQSKALEVHLIDRRNHHLFQPLLYQVAMAGLNPSDIAIPIRKLFTRQKNVRVTLAEVSDIDVEMCSVQYDNRWHQFDYLILACGAKHSYFGNTEWEPIAPGLKNIEQATEIRRRILTAFEMAEKETDLELQKSYLTFVVVGGGPTGVELAGAISEMAKTTLKQDYKVANLDETRVYLLESGPRVLSSFPERLSLRATRDLTEMGVIVLTNTRAQNLSFQGLFAGNRWIPCKTIIWAAGVQAANLSQKLSTPKDGLGRIKVLSDLSLPHYPKIFAIGDIAFFEGSDKKSLPGIAPVAIQQGEWVARMILREIKGQGRSSFTYWDKGMMATIGRSRAVVISGPFQLTGFFAWLAWVFVHIVYLMRFRNRFFVFLQWVWAYFRFGQGARLIIQKSWRFYEGKTIKYDNE